MAIFVTALTRGVTMLVLSSRPPSPTSTTAISAPRAAKSAKAIAVVASKNVAPSSCTRGAMRAVHIATAASEIGTPSTRIRSRNETRWGEVYSPTRHPAQASASATRAATLPLPLVPPTWMEGMTVCGSPSSERSARGGVEPELDGGGAWEEEGQGFVVRQRN